ncbi:tetratricopeptide repeat protein [Shimia ponticola]|uniref:tetratricopeptide repeat protein n=1 Tax=Shimia ponticola TaxID=2582893 RepID=UPI0011BE7C4F|nr:tetratricopeptide repeat protein [Shimia ponticola]
MRLIWAVVIALWAGGATAQTDAAREQSLADIRQELSVLFVEIQRLKQELSTTGAPQGVSGATLLDRVDGIETQLQRLTARTEQLEFRINQIVQDGTNRIGDLEFRLVELEGGDISQLGETSTLGGEAAAPAPTPVPVPDNTGLTVNETDDFNRAKAALDAGEFAQAADQFEAFVEAYPGGPMTLTAMLHKGEAHEGLGEMRAAARAYLDAFSADPVGPEAPQALLKVGTSLGAIGATQEACITLAEVGIRFPGGPAETQANSARTTLGCE